MKYWCYSPFNEVGDPVVVTLSEGEIIAQYWSYWYTQMCSELPVPIKGTGFLG
jgi:hypothetical protein